LLQIRMGRREKKVEKKGKKERKNGSERGRVASLHTSLEKLVGFIPTFPLCRSVFSIAEQRLGKAVTD